MAIVTGTDGNDAGLFALFRTSAGDKLIGLDATGAGKALEWIRLDGLHALTVDDFIRWPAGLGPDP